MANPGSSEGCHDYYTPSGKRRWRRWYRDENAVQRKAQGFKTRRECDEWWYGVDGKGGKRAEILDGLNVKEGTRADKVARYQELWEEHTTVVPKTKTNGVSVWKNHVKPAFGDAPVSTVTTARVRSWVTTMTNNGVGDATRYLALAQLSRVMDMAVEYRAIPVNPTAGVSAGKTKSRKIKSIDRALSPQQVYAIIDAMDPRFMLFVKVLAFTGMRSGEACALIVRNLNLDDDKPTIWVDSSLSRVGGVTRGPTKTGEARLVSVSRELADELATHVAGKDDDDYVFTGAEGSSPIHYSNWLRRYWNPAVEAARAEIVMPDTVVPHELRHFFATTALTRGVPMATVKTQLGHSSITVTIDMYARWDRESSAQAANVVAEAVAGVEEAVKAAQYDPFPDGTFERGEDGFGYWVSDV